MQQEFHVYHHSRAEGLLNPLRALVQNPNRMLKKYIRPDDQVLDLGCGPGFFSLRIAQMLSSQGHVTAVDIQPEMLEKLEKQCTEQGLEDKISTHLQPAPDKIGLDDSFDLVLAFFMLHEVGDREAYLAQIRSLLPPHGLFLLVEPEHVVSLETFELEIAQAKRAGLYPVIFPRIFLSRAAYFSPV